MATRMANNIAGKTFWCLGHRPDVRSLGTGIARSDSKPGAREMTPSVDVGWLTQLDTP